MPYRIQDVIDQKFVGVPYKFGGYSFEGADALGMAILFFKEYGINFEYEDGKGIIDKDWFMRSPRRFIDAMLTHGDIVTFSELKKFDCLLVTAPHNSGIAPMCIAVMVDDRHVLASNETRGSFVDMVNIYWKESCWGCLRLHKVKEKGL